MPPTTDQFIEQWIASGLINRAGAEAARQAHASGDDAGAFAKALVRSGTLTKFQAQLILQRKGNTLTLGNYAILDRLGAGGMGQVFLAEHRRMKRRVALKVLAPKLVSDKGAIERFRREVEAAARLSHPNIVGAFDADEANGVHYLVMEYVAGQDLASLVAKSGPLPVATAVDCIRQAAAGLQYAHASGVIHRDIKPGNLLLNEAGAIKVLDMGLARVESVDGNQGALTGTGIMMGTVDYMAPEQAEDTHAADARADIYSLGCTLHYLLTGKPVYGGDTILRRILAHREEAVPSLRAYRGEVSPELDRVFQRMIAKRPADRYASMEEVTDALHRAQAGIPELIAPPLLLQRDGDDSFGSFLTSLDSSDATFIGTGEGAAHIAADAATIQASGSDTAARTLPQPLTSSSTTAMSGAHTLQRRGRRAWYAEPLLWGGAAALLALVVGVWQLATQPAPSRTGPQQSSTAGDTQGAPATAATSTTPATPDEIAAVVGWALARGATLTVGNESSGMREIRSVAQWEEQRLPVRSLTFSKESRIGNDDLARLRAFDRLTNLSLAGTSISDDGLRQLSTLSRLETLDLSSTQVTDAGLPAVSRLVNLKSLVLKDTQVAGGGLQNLAGLQKLELLHLDGLPIHDDHLKLLPLLPNLVSVSLVGCQALTDSCAGFLNRSTCSQINLQGVAITDAGLEKLRTNRSLRFLWLNQTPVTAAGVIALARACPITGLYLFDIPFTPEELQQLRDAMPEGEIYSHLAVPPRAGNILAKIDPARDAVSGQWKKTGSLFTPPPAEGEVHLIRIPVDSLPECYSLSMMISRSSSHRQGGIAIGFRVDGRSGVLVVDDTNPSGWGIETIDQPRTTNGTNVDVAQCRIHESSWQPAGVVVQLLPTGLARIQGTWFHNAIVQWTGDPEQLSVPDAMQIPDWDGLFFASWGNFGIHGVELTPLDPTAAPGYRELKVPVAETGWPDVEPVALSPGEILTSPDWEWSEPVNVGPRINSDRDEYVPWLSPDGLTLYQQTNKLTNGVYTIGVTRRSDTAAAWRPVSLLHVPFELDSQSRHHHCLTDDECVLVAITNVGTHYHIWESVRTSRSEPFGVPGFLGAEINLPGVDTQFPVLSNDGLTLCFNRYDSGHWDIWWTERDSRSAPWQTPVWLEGSVNTPANERPAWLSPDRIVLIFSSDRDTTNGDSDLWCSVRTAPTDPWPEPISLGPIINSDKPEFCGRLLSDNRTLLFDSHRLSGYGGGDIWISRRVPKPGTDAEQQWPHLRRAELSSEGLNRD